MTDKSNICTDPIKAQKASQRHKEIIKVDTELLEKVCPNPCLQVSSFYASQEEYHHNNEEHELAPGTLTLHYRRFIKVSETHWSYAGLSLMAEVGGYVGLFLGISVNQIRFLLDKLLILRCK